MGDTEVRRGRSFTKATLALVVLVLVLIAGSSRWDQAGAQEASPERAVPEAPKLEARAWALMDSNTGLYLAGKNPDERLPIASTTNVMTALVALEEEVNLNEEVTISKEAESYVGFIYSNVGLIAGERVTVRDLLVATLVPSGTDAVYALAEHLGDGSVERFVEKMNQKADSMGLENTHFTNPAGLDDEENYSSARELAKITRAAMEHPEFAEIADTEEATISTQSREIEVFTTNDLLYTYGEATGVKTGTSPEAGPCLIASAEEGKESYVAVVLDAQDEQYRFQAAQVALGYGFEAYERRALVRQGEVYEELTLPYRPRESVGLAAARDVRGVVGPGLEAERRATHKRQPPLRAEADQELGSVELLIDGKSIGNSPLITDRTYQEASLWEKAWYALERPVGKAWTLLRERL